MAVKTKSNKLFLSSRLCVWSSKVQSWLQEGGESSREAAAGLGLSSMERTVVLSSWFSSPGVQTPLDSKSLVPTYFWSSGQTSHPSEKSQPSSCSHVLMWNSLFQLMLCIGNLLCLCAGCRKHQLTVLSWWDAKFGIFLWFGWATKLRNGLGQFCYEDRV